MFRISNRHYTASGNMFFIEDFASTSVDDYEGDDYEGDDYVDDYEDDYEDDVDDPILPIQPVIDKDLPSNIFNSVYYVNNNLGINQPNPKFSLDVLGNTNVDGDITLSGELSDINNYLKINSNLEVKGKINNYIDNISYDDEFMTPAFYFNNIGPGIYNEARIVTFSKGYPVIISTEKKASAVGAELCAVQTVIPWKDRNAPEETVGIVGSQIKQFIYSNNDAWYRTSNGAVWTKGSKMNNSDINNSTLPVSNIVLTNPTPPTPDPTSTAPIASMNAGLMYQTAFDTVSGMNGPVLYGYDTGVLGLITGTQKNAVMKWDNTGVSLMPRMKFTIGSQTLTENDIKSMKDIIKQMSSVHIDDKPPKINK